MRRSFPAYVVVPQTRDRSANYINDTHGLRVSQPGAPLADVLALVDELMRRHPIDPARVYALGFRWRVRRDGRRRGPGLFAAMVALSGVPPERSLARAVAHVPTLLIHGDYDQENAYVGAQVWAEELAPPAVGPGSSPMSAWTIACRRSCSPTAPGANGCSSSASRASAVVDPPGHGTIRHSLRPR